MSTTVMVPVVGPEPPFETVMVYVSPISPCLKMTEWVFVIVRSAARITVVISPVESFAVLISPPPETTAVLVTLGGALLATFTVTIRAG